MRIYANTLERNWVKAQTDHPAMRNDLRHDAAQSATAWAERAASTSKTDVYLFTKEQQRACEALCAAWGPVEVEDVTPGSDAGLNQG